jgi:hypothetical protein
MARSIPHVCFGRYVGVELAGPLEIARPIRLNGNKRKSFALKADGIFGRDSLADSDPPARAVSFSSPTANAVL